MVPHFKLGSGWMLFAALFFTLMGTCVNLAAPYFSFYEMIFYRSVFALIVLTLIAYKNHQDIRTPYLGGQVWRGVIGSISMMCYFYALSHLPLATAMTLSYTSSIWLALFSMLFLHERVNTAVFFNLGTGFVGIILLLNPSFSSGQAFPAMIGLANGAAAGLAYLQVRELAQKGEPDWRTVWYFSLTSLVLSGLWMPFGGVHFAAQGLLPLLGVAVFALLAQLTMTHAYSVGRKFVVASLSYFTVVFSAIIGMLWLGDHLPWQAWSGVVLITLSGLAGSFLRRQR